MITVHQWIAETSVWFWPGFADHLWQATLFGLVILGTSWALKKGPARLRHSFWLLASAKFIVPASFLVILAQQAGMSSLLQFSDQAEERTAVLQGLAEPVTAFAGTYEVNVNASSAGHNEIYCALTLVWLSGSIGLLAIWGMRRQQFYRSLEQSRTVNAGREWDALKRAEQFLGVNREVKLVITSGKLEPAVWGVLRPVVVLPQSIETLLDDKELETILLHELCHVERRDNLVGNVQLMLCALLWFHPLVWFISRQLSNEREQACDEKVMEVGGAPEAYASSILKVVRFCFGWRFAGVTGAASGSNLRRRIEIIMTMRNTKLRVKPAARLLASGMVVCALLILVGAGVYSRTGVANEVQQPEAPRVTATTPVEAPQAPSAPSQPTKQTETTPVAPPAPVAPVKPATPTGETPSSPALPARAPETPPSPATPANSAAPVAPAAPTSPAVPPKDTQGRKSKDKVEKGELIEAPRPVYPDEAKKQKVEGRVTVDIVIDEEGKVISATPASGPEMLHASSRDAAFKARFKPTLVNGKPAKVSGAMSYNFVLDKE